MAPEPRGGGGGGEGGWRGLLLVLAPFHANERSLLLRIEAADPGGDRGVRAQVAAG